MTTITAHQWLQTTTRHEQTALNEWIETLGANPGDYNQLHITEAGITLTRQPVEYATRTVAPPPRHLGHVQPPTEVADAIRRIWRTRDQPT